MRTLRQWFYMVCYALALSIPLLATAPLNAAEQGQAAVPARYHTIVDLDTVKAYAIIPRRTDVVIVDSRPKARKYDKGHIPTAISIPDREFDALAKKLPEDRNTLLIFYCGGPKCMLSHKSAFKAEKLGYTNVKVFTDGYPAWIKAGLVGAVSTEYIKKLIDSGAKAMIVDARPKKRKYDKGHIPTAVSIPYREFDQHVGKLPEDKSTLLVFYCGGFKCTLSPKSADKAMALGYTNVKMYPAGMPAWVKTYGKEAVETGDAAGAGKSGVKIKAGGEEGTISIDSFKQLLEQTPDQVMVVDVRDPPEFKTGSFPTAVNIPIDDLEKRIDSLPTGKPIVFVCNSGGLAGEAYDIVKLLRKELQAYFLEAEATFKPDGSYEIQPIAG